MDFYIGEIRLFPYTYPPRGWTYCDGQFLPIAQHGAAFAVLGVAYGGDGTTTFGVPNLQGRVPLGSFQGPGLSSYRRGEFGGTNLVNLNESNLPAHIHTLKASENPANQASLNQPNLVPGQLAKPGRGGSSTIVNAYSDSRDIDGSMNAGTLSPSGGNSAHENRQPFIVIPFCICLDGIFPPRS